MFAASAGEVFLNHLQPFGEVLIFSTFSLNLDFIVKMYWGDMEPPQSMKILQVAACLVRVPTEIVKQRRQAGAGSHGLAIVRSTISSEVPTTTWHIFSFVCFSVSFHLLPGSAGAVQGLLHHPGQGDSFLSHPVPTVGVLEEATGHSHRTGTGNPLTISPKFGLLGSSYALASLFVWCCSWGIFCSSDHTPRCGKDEDNAGQGSDTPWVIMVSLINCVSQAGTSEASLGTLGMMKWVLCHLKYQPGDMVKCISRFVLAEKGASGLFAGVSPRVTWISIGDNFQTSRWHFIAGGAVFFGVYEKAKSVLS